MLPVAKIKLPSCLKKQNNGRLDSNILVKFGMGSFVLVEPAARSMKALVAAAFKEGYVVWTTGTYRTYAQQVDLFINRHTNSKVIGSNVKLWDNKMWWLKPDRANAARPGTSNHGLGLASDFALKDSRNRTVSVTHPFVKWMCVNAATYGYSAEIQSENWHWRYVAGDVIPKAVVEFEVTI